jgi:hypothetical protein
MNPKGNPRLALATKVLPKKTWLTEERITDFYAQIERIRAAKIRSAPLLGRWRKGV